MKVVSACLAGKACRYDGRAKPELDLIRMVEKGEAIALCPEEMAGLGTPRPPCEINQEGKILTTQMSDITVPFYKGAELALEECLKAGVRTAILKARSPMCGKGEIYDGTFSGTLREGNGLFAQLLEKEGIKIESR